MDVVDPQMFCYKFLLLALIIVGCDTNDPTGNNDVTYSTSDLDGAWIGDVTVADSPNAGIYNISISFDSKGNWAKASLIMIGISLLI